MGENDINLTALVSCKNKYLSFCWKENTRFVPIFVLSVQCNWDRYRSICSAIKCPLEITVDDYFVTSNGVVHNAIQAAYIVLLIMGYKHVSCLPSTIILTASVCLPTCLFCSCVCMCEPTTRNAQA